MVLLKSWLIDIEQLKIEKELYCDQRAVWLSEKPIVFERKLCTAVE